MRARTILIILLVMIVLIAFGPAIIAVGSQEIAETFGCQVDLNRAIPCVIHGKDYGDLAYNLGFAIWYSYLTLPAGVVLFAIWLVPATIVLLAALRKRKQPGA
jgi:TRAP-type C4-dicarboxylate transport system permease small subunit